MAEVEGKTYGMMFEKQKNGNVVVSTFFKDNPKKMQDWFLDKTKP